MIRKRIAFLFLILTTAACAPTTATPTLLQQTPTSSGTPTIELSLTPSVVPSTPAPTATFAPAPRDFTEEFNGSLPYWAFTQVDNGNPFPGPSVEAGYLVFDLPAPDQWAYALYGGPDYADVRVDAQVELRSGDDGAVGVVCRYSEKNGWYEFNIYADQTYTLLFGQWLAQGVARYMPVFKSSSEKIKSGSNEIGLLCQGNVLTPFINGVRMRQWQEKKYGLQQGKIGVSASSFQNVPFIAAFDWVKVSAP
ncbi:MAG: hypothetical protein M1282_13035 [Chloroflexi bacterium]|nr:hypothetical protein [Chloroflexota bacterium]